MAIKVTKDTEAIRIEASDGSEVIFRLDDIYQEVKHRNAKEDIRTYLLDEGFRQNAIDTIVTDEFVRRWLKSVSNHETIAECYQLTAVEIANELGHKWYGEPPFKAGDTVTLAMTGDLEFLSGLTAKVLRELKDGEEYDRYEVGYMYKVLCKNGTELQVFQDEIRKAGADDEAQ